MKFRIRIMRGSTPLFTGTFEASDENGHYGYGGYAPWRAREVFSDDVFYIERVVNTAGALRMHVEEVTEAKGGGEGD